MIQTSKKSFLLLTQLSN